MEPEWVTTEVVSDAGEVAADAGADEEQREPTKPQVATDRWVSMSRSRRRLLVGVSPAGTSDNREALG